MDDRAIRYKPDDHFVPDGRERWRKRSARVGGPVATILDWCESNSKSAKLQDALGCLYIVSMSRVSAKVVNKT